MPVYTAPALKGNQTATAEFQARGLELAAGTATQISAIGIPHYRQIAYQNYVSNISAFMKVVCVHSLLFSYSNISQATIERRRLPLVSFGYPFDLRSAELLSLGFPPLSVTFDAKLSDSDEKKIESLGGTLYSFGRKRTATFRLYALSVIQDVGSIGKPDWTAASPRGSVNIAGLKAFLEVSKLITAFLKTHCYPTFDSNNDKVPRYDSIEGFVRAKRVCPIDGPFKSVKIARLDDGLSMETDTEDSVEDELGMNTYGFGTRASAEESIPYARPSDIALPFFTDGQTIPRYDGLAFPYFPGLLTEDYSFVPDRIWRYFAASLGSTKDDLAPAFRSIRGGHGQYAMTSQGLIIQHLMIGVQLATECQAKLLPVLTMGSYRGFVLGGGHFRVHIHNCDYLPLPYDTLIKEVRSIDLHSVALAMITERLATLEIAIDDPKDDEKDPENALVTSTRMLRRLTLARERSPEDDVAITRYANDLAFPERYWPITGEKTLEAFNLIVASVLVPDDMPMYAKGGVLTTDSDALSILSAFGEIAPSLRGGGGRPILIPDSVDKDSLLKIAPGKKSPSINAIIIQKKNLFQAANDFSEMLRERAIHNKIERSSAFRSTRLGESQMKEFWYGLIELFKIVPRDEIVASNVIVESRVVKTASKVGDVDISSFL